MTTPLVSVADIQRVATGELSLASRVGHTSLLITSLTVAVGIGSLLATEPALPLRAQIAFTVILVMAVCWSAFAAWVLARRRVLFGKDRVVAACLGLTFSAVGTAGMLAVGYWGGAGASAYVAAAIEGVLCSVAAGLLVRARRDVAALQRRRRELEAQIAVGHGFR